METTVRKYVSIWNENSISDLKNVLMPHSNYWDAIQEGNAIETLSESIAMMHNAFPDITFEVCDITIVSDNKIFLEWKMIGTNKGSFFGAEPTGKIIEINGLDNFQFENGKITDIKSFYDSTLFNM